MAKRKTIARRETPPCHIVTVDTNILWHEDKAFPVSPDFEKFWDENSALIPLELAISEVVIGELKFQQTTSALKRLKTVSTEIEEISKIASFKHVNKIKESSVKNQVNDKIDKWLQNIRGSIIEIPINKIDWKKLIHSAIWRLPPFTYDPKEKINEKGFRDALILETFLSLCALNAGSNKNIVFVCNDYLLRETAKSHSTGNEKILIFESLQDFGSYIQLTQKNLTDKFVKDIQKRARAKFWKRSDQNSIFYKDKTTDRINNEFASQISSPLYSGLMGLGSWYQHDSRWFIGSTQFHDLVVPHDFHWVSRVILAQLFSNKDRSATGALSMQAPAILSGLSGPPELQQIRLFNFDVSWKAKVKADGRFHDNEVKNIIIADTPVITASEENLARWGFSV